MYLCVCTCVCVTVCVAVCLCMLMLLQLVLPLIVSLVHVLFVCLCVVTCQHVPVCMYLCVCDCMCGCVSVYANVAPTGAASHCLTCPCVVTMSVCCSLSTCTCVCGCVCRRRTKRIRSEASPCYWIIKTSPWANFSSSTWTLQNAWPSCGRSGRTPNSVHLHGKSVASLVAHLTVYTYMAQLWQFWSPTKCTLTSPSCGSSGHPQKCTHTWPSCGRSGRIPPQCTLTWPYDDREISMGMDLKNLIVSSSMRAFNVSNNI